MTQNHTASDFNPSHQQVSHSVRAAADRVDHAVGTIDRAAASVQSNVSDGIQPDMRELRQLMADLRDTVSIAFRRIFWAVIAGIALNIVVLVVLLTR